ncbi:hypothetical protein ACLMJK_002753 [Lecanora helva]
MSRMDISEKINAVETIISYRFSNKSLLSDALYAAGVPHISSDGNWHPEGNKRPAIIGDTVLKLALMEAWYRTTSLTGLVGPFQAIMEIATNENLDSVGKRLGLDKHVILAPGVDPTQVPWRTMAATVEAILGAVYFDGGMVAVRQVMGKMGLVPALLTL